MHLRHGAKVMMRRRSDGKCLILWSSEWEENPVRSHAADLPGGIVEKGETLEEGLIREIIEETGVTVHEHDLTLAYAQVWDYDDVSSVFLVYFAEVDDPEIVLSWEHERYAWLSLDELAKLEIRQPFPTVFAQMQKVGLLH